MMRPASSGRRAAPVVFGRVHTIEDSPHRRGSAYVSVYRMYLNDFKPYLYMTNDYGTHWTLLTDGANGIPADQPMHVVREDPEQEGLLYAGFKPRPAMRIRYADALKTEAVWIFEGNVFYIAADVLQRPVQTQCQKQ